MSTEPKPIPYDWIRDVHPDLLKIDDIPLLGPCPPFPWEQLSQNLSQLFEIEGFSITPGEIQWRNAEELYAGLGNPLASLHLNIAPLDGILCWVMPEQEIVLLMSLLLLKKVEPLDIQDPSFQEAFYRFLALEVLHVVDQLEFDQSLTPLLRDTQSLPSTPSLCLDVTININQHSFLGRLIIPPEMRLSWKKHHAKLGKSAISEKIAEKADVKVHIQGGRTTMSLADWSKVEAGDFILLDTCSLSVDEDKGRVILVVNGMPLFRAKVKDGNLKILEPQQINEVDPNEQ